jgi:hypothetical protein
VTTKDYPPAPIVHDARCEDAPEGVPVPPRGVLQSYPNATVHTCFSNATVTSGRGVIVEQGDYEPHPYEESTVTTVEVGVQAARPLCRTCRGTHPDEPPAEDESGPRLVIRFA